jgi:uncharacterized damage-inducible protein DinB
MQIRSLAVAVVLIYSNRPSVCVAQSPGARTTHPSAVYVTTLSDTASLAQDRANFRLMMTSAVRRNIVSAAEAMPADKYGFAPTAGEFRNVRTFSRQIRHLAATNFILAAAALGQDPPADVGDEEGPDSVVTKAQHLTYLNKSFDALEKAIDAIGDSRIGVRPSPISPFQGNTATRLSLISEALTHAYDHYGQMVVYLRMNGVIPPASRR